HNGGVKKFAGKNKTAGGKKGGNPQIKNSMGSLWADDNPLQGHLQNQEFFKLATYPLSTLSVTSIQPEGDKQKVTGNLNMHGVTKSISFPADIQASDSGVTIKAEFSINRRDFNINYAGMPNDLIRDNVVIKLDIKATPGPAKPEDQLA